MPASARSSSSGSRTRKPRPSRIACASSAPRGTRPSVDAGLATVADTAAGTGNLLPPMREALRARATLGEVSDVLRGVFGEYRPTY